jgi:hypothetical protein
VVNGSTHPLALRVSLDLTYGTAGHKAKAVTDAGKGYRGISPSRLGPAGRAEGQFAFAVPRGHAIHLVFTGRPAINYQPQSWSFPDP